MSSVIFRIDAGIVSSYKERVLTTEEAAQRLKRSVRQVQTLIAQGKLPARRFGRSYVIDEKDLDLVRNLKRGPVPKKAAKKKR